MKNQSTHSSDQTTAWNLTRPVLSSKSADAAVHLLSPGAILPEVKSGGELVLYVAQGGLIATVGAADFFLNCDETLLVPANRTWSARNSGASAAKVFVLQLPRKHAEAVPLVFPA